MRGGVRPAASAPPPVGTRGRVTAVAPSAERRLLSRTLGVISSGCRCGRSCSSAGCGELLKPQRHNQFRSFVSLVI